MARIFINYRRDDTPGVAGRLFDHLAMKYSRRELFMDVDAMQPGRDFAKQLESQVSQCHVLLAVIGPHWLDARDQAGKRRLDNDKDYVRIEIASALQRDIAVIPVLLDGAAMPSEESLPDNLKPLVRRHALELRHTRFAADADAIVHALEAVVPRRSVPWTWVGGGIALAAVVAIALLWPKLSAKLRPPAQPTIELSAKPATPNPPAASLPPVASSPPVASVPPVASLPPMAKPAAPTPQPTSPALANAVSPAGPPAGVRLGEMLHGINLSGSTMHMIDILPDNPATCQVACRAEPRCVAWTYGYPRTPGEPGHCSLKPVIPGQVANNCCTSAIERVPDPDLREAPAVPAAVAGALRGIDLVGGDYRAFGGPQVNPEGCQAACRAEARCLAWTYARPGITTSDARCFLKGRIPPQVGSACCISGIEAK
jgi:hypothetical protein